MRQTYSNELRHYQAQGAKWGVRRWQYPDGSLTPAGREHYREMYGRGSARAKKKRLKGIGEIVSSPFYILNPKKMVKRIKKGTNRIIDANVDDYLNKSKFHDYYDNNGASNDKMSWQNSEPAKPAYSDKDSNNKNFINRHDDKYNGQQHTRSISERIGEKLSTDEKFENRPDLSRMTDFEVHNYLQRLEDINKINNYYKKVDDAEVSKGEKFLKDTAKWVGLTATAVGAIALLTNNTNNTAKNVKAMKKMVDESKEAKKQAGKTVKETVIKGFVRK